MTELEHEHVHEEPELYPVGETIPLTVVEWTDTSNVAAWTTMDELREFGKNRSFIVRNCGYLMYEDDNCVVLAARLALDAEPAQVGLYERIPKSVIIQRWVMEYQQS